ncbi:MAG: DUF4330 domain-containing protein [Oscillibacter sp.]|nr:DUF4330 domain-containing protein [Oscillibacter sp.]
MKKNTGRVRYNIVDLAAVALIVLVALIALWKLVVDRDVETTKPVTMYFTVMAEGVSADLYDGVKDKLPAKLMASGRRLNGQVNSVEKRPYLVLGPDGQWVEDPDHVNLVFDCVNVSNAGNVFLSKVDEQEARVGRKDYTLKTEYMEFHNTIVLEVTLEGWEIPELAPIDRPLNLG